MRSGKRREWGVPVGIAIMFLMTGAFMLADYRQRKAAWEADPYALPGDQRTAREIAKVHAIRSCQNQGKIVGRFHEEEPGYFVFECTKIPGTP